MEDMEDGSGFGEYAVERGYCMRGRKDGEREKLRNILGRQPPFADEPNCLYVQELIDEGLPEMDDALTSPRMLSESGLYRIGDWSVCLMVKDPNLLVFRSIEKHFEYGHLQFKISPDILKERIVAVDNIFESVDDAIHFLTEDECSHSHCCSEEGSETIEVGYWDDLFEAQAGEATEWLVSYPTLAPHLAPYLEPHHKILVIGCGNSDLSTRLYDDGFRNITSMDISPVVIQQMKEKFGNCTEMRWDVEDVMAMSYPDNSFDVVVDKSLMDCIFHCGKHEEKVAGMLPELHRVLKKGTGIAIFLTTQGPDQVMPFLEDTNCGVWSTEQAYLTVAVDCEGRVPKNAFSVLNDILPSAALSKAFRFYFCHAVANSDIAH